MQVVCVLFAGVQGVDISILRYPLGVLSGGVPFPGYRIAKESEGHC